MVTSAGSCRTGEIEGVGTVELVCWQIAEDVAIASAKFRSAR